MDALELREYEITHYVSSFVMCSKGLSIGLGFRVGVGVGVKVRVRVRVRVKVEFR